MHDDESIQLGLKGKSVRLSCLPMRPWDWFQIGESHGKTVRVGMTVHPSAVMIVPSGPCPSCAIITALGYIQYYAQAHVLTITYTYRGHRLLLTVQ